MGGCVSISDLDSTVPKDPKYLAQKYLPIA